MADPISDAGLARLLRLVRRVDDGEYQIEVFRRQIDQQVPYHRLVWPVDELLCTIEVQDWLANSLVTVAHPAPRLAYHKRFSKELLKRVENAINNISEPDISDALASRCASLLPIPDPISVDLAQHDNLIVYTPPILPVQISSTRLSLITFEKERLISGLGGTGYRTWEAALYLGTHLCQGHRDIRGKSVLELGAGTGLLSMLCAKILHAKHVVATDEDPEVLRRLIMTLNSNEMQNDSKVETFKYEWGTSVDQLPLAGKQMDVILGADITYDPSGTLPLAKTISNLIALNPHVLVLLSAAIRNEDTFKSFEKAFFDSNLVLFQEPIKDIPQCGFFHDTETPINIFVVKSDGRN